MFEEIDYKKTPMGELVLRRRAEPRLGGREVYEVKLGEEFLMSSLFHEGEEALARLALAQLDGDDLDVVVGGLGLGYTAAAALADPRVRDLLVVESMAGVIDWHERGLVPLGTTLAGDDRCRFINADFFQLAAATGFDPDRDGRRFHALLLDIDHAPDHLLHENHAGFYRPEGLLRLQQWLHPGGVFGLWSNDPRDDGFVQRLKDSFAGAEAHVVSFPNPYTDGESTNTVYVAVNAK
jgi:spermidine synthase